VIRRRRSTSKEADVARSETTPGRIRFDDGALAKRLATMRGGRVTPLPAGSGAVLPARHDQVEQLSLAARDALWVDRTIEDNLLSTVTEYRSIDRPSPD
jgi:hypothetical protein